MKKEQFNLLFALISCLCIGTGITVLPLFENKSGLEHFQEFLTTIDDDVITVSDWEDNSSGLGWELLDNGTVLHMWNNYDSYYFNRSNGIQFSNHYQEYWTTNVLMLGYYDGDTWNLIYRTDELSGFNENIENTPEYINATLWKDLSYGPYDFRLAIRYHLGANDNDLTVTPYIKNLGIPITQTIGFGWEMKDIKIDMTVEDDYFRLDDHADASNTTSFSLHNNTLDWSSSNLTQIYTPDNETDFTWRPNTIFYLDNWNSYGVPDKTLYLKWNHSLNYLLQVKARNNQYNAPVTLFIKVGTLGVGQEKSTKLFWYDADVTYGTPQAWNSVAVRDIRNSIDKIATNKFVVGYLNDSGVQSEGVVVVGSVSGTIITFGTFVEVAADVYLAYGGIDVCVLDTDKFVVIYCDNALANDLYARIGTVSGTTITLSSAQEIADTDAEYMACVQVDTDKFVFCYNNETSGNHGFANVATVSGTTITVGTAYPFTVAGDFPKHIALDMISSDDFAIAWEREGTDNSLQSVVGTISGTAITFGSMTQVSANNPNYITVNGLDTDKFIINYHDQTTDTNKAVAGTASGTTITYGSIVEIDDSGSPFAGSCAIDTSHFLSFYGDDADGNSGKSRYCTVNWGDRSISFGNAEQFETGFLYYPAAVMIDTTKVVIAYEDSDNSGYGTAVIGDTPSVGNSAPTITGEIPANTSTGISLTPVCNVTANDEDGGDTLTVTFWENTTGSYVMRQKNTSVSPGTSVQWDNYSNAHTELTKYWWKVYVDDATDNVSETYYFTTAVNRTWQNLSYGYLIGGNVSSFENLSYGYLLGGNISSFTNTSFGYLSGGNITGWTNLSYGFLSGGNVSGYINLSYGYLIGGNTTGRTWHNLSFGYLLGGNASSYANLSFGSLLGGNSTSFTNLSYGYLLGGNITSYINISYGYLTGGNVSSYVNLSYGHLLGGNTSSYTNLSYGYLSGGNTTDYRNISYGWLTGGNVSVKSWNNLSYGFLTGGNISSFTNITYGYLIGGNTSGYINLSYGHLLGGNNTGWSNISYGYLLGGNSTLFTNLSYGYLLGGNESVKGWNNLSYGYLLGGNISSYENLSYGYLIGGNVSSNINISYGYLSGGNVTGYINISYGYLTGGNISSNVNLSYGYLLGGNITGRTWHNLTYGYLLGGNITSYTNISYGYLDGGNVSSHVNLSYGYLNGGNTTILPIVFSNENPVNGSTGQETELTWNVTIETTNGDTFNWWINCSNGQESMGYGYPPYNTPSLPSSGDFEEKWNVSMISLGVSSLANPTIQDIDGDGIMEIFMAGKTNFTVGETDPKLLLTCINGSTGITIWNETYYSGTDGSGNNYFGTMVYDFNKDGEYNVITNSMVGPTVMRYASNGTEVWNESAVATGWHQQAYVDFGDEVFLYLVGSPPTSQFIKKVNGSTGTIVDYAPQPYTCWGGVSIADLDDDGHYELFTTDRDTGTDRGLRCYNMTDLSLKWNKDIACSSHTSTIADFDKDGELEVMVVDQGWPYHVYIYDVDGNLEHESSVVLDHHHQSAVGDVDGDGNLELVCGDMTVPKIYDLYTHTLETTPNWEIISHSGEIYDVIPDDNNISEILNTGDQGTVSSNMASIWQYNTTSGIYDKVYEFGHRIVWSVVADVDFDGYKELITGYCSNYAFGKSMSYYRCYETNAPVDIPAPITSMAFGGTRRLNNDEFIAPPGKYEYITYGESNGSKELILTGLEYSTEYTLWVNATDSTNWTREWFNFTTKAEPNDPPIIKNPLPSNNTGDQDLVFTWNVTIEDPEGVSFDWWINCSHGETNSSSSDSNGTKNLSISGLSYNTEYRVWVNVTDGVQWTRKWYNFTTETENIAPTIESPIPANNSVRQPLSLTWSVFINDSDIEDFNWWIECNNSQSSNSTESRYVGASKSESDGTQSFENDIIGIPWNMTSDTRARASNISIYWRCLEDPKKVRCALYDTNKTLIVETEERTLALELGAWESLNFSYPGPILEPSTEYYIVAFVQQHNGPGAISYDWTSGDNSTAWIQYEYGYNSSGGEFPTDWTPTQWGNDSRTVHMRLFYNSTLDGEKNVLLSGLSYDTQYNLWVNATDGKDWTNRTYNFNTSSVIAWQNLSYGFLSGGNISTLVNISYGYLLGGNVSSYVNLTSGYLTGGNSSVQPIACFTYQIVGVNLYLHSCSTNVGPTTEYMWNITSDGVIYGSTGWILGIDGINYITSYPDGGDVCILLSIRRNSLSDSTELCTDEIEITRDEYDYDHYNTSKSCHDAGYYWYDEECHEDPKTDPWNEENTVEDYKDAGYEAVPSIEIFGWHISYPLLIFIIIIGALCVLVFGKRKRRKKKK